MRMSGKVKCWLPPLLLLLSCCGNSLATPFEIVTANTKVSIFYDTECKLNSIAANLLAADIELLSGYRPTVSGNINQAKGNVIIIGSLNSTLVRGFGNKVS